MCGFEYGWNKNEAVVPTEVFGFIVNLETGARTIQICPKCQVKLAAALKNLLTDFMEHIVLMLVLWKRMIQKERKKMIKTVQVEEKRCICDICCTKYHTMHGVADTKREGWVHADNFANLGKNLDICPTCVEFLKEHLDTFSEYMNEPGSGKTNG